METVTVSVDAVGVLTLTLSRPKRKNAVNNKMYTEIVEVLKKAETDPAVKAVVLTGAGGATPQHCVSCGHVTNTCFIYQKHSQVARMYLRATFPLMRDPWKINPSGSS